MPDGRLFRQYQGLRKRALMMGLLFILSFFLVLTVSVRLGKMDIPAGQVARIILSKLTGVSSLLSGIRANAVAVVWEIRLPRVIAGYLVGAGLATAGVIFQALLANPLADPYTLGVSTGAAFGATLAIVLNLVFSANYPTTPFAFLFAALALLAVLLMAEKGGGVKSANLIIAGMIVSAILSSAISFLKMVSGEHVGAIVYWMMGSVSAKSWKDLWFLAPLVLAGAAVAYRCADQLNLMTLGDRAAEALGVQVRRLRLTLLIAGAAVTAACVSVSGIIGFVGLIVPHMMRLAVSGDNRRLLPLSFLAGGLLLMLADDAARLIGHGDIPVGVLTTLLGGPFFIHLFVKRGRR